MPPRSLLYCTYTLLYCYITTHTTLLHIYAALLLHSYTYCFTAHTRCFTATLLHIHTCTYLAFRAREYELTAALLCMLYSARCFTAALLLRYYTYTHPHTWLSARESMRLTVPPRSPSEVLGVSMCNFVRVKQVNRVPSEFLVIFTVTGFAAYVSIRQHTSAYVSMRTFGVLSDIHSHGVCELQVLQRQRSLNRLAHTSSYVSIRQHTFTRQRRLDLLAFIIFYYT